MEKRSKWKRNFFKSQNCSALKYLHEDDGENTLHDLNILITRKTAFIFVKTTSSCSNMLMSLSRVDHVAGATRCYDRVTCCVCVWTIRTITCSDNKVSATPPPTSHWPGELLVISMASSTQPFHAGSGWCCERDRWLVNLAAASGKMFCRWSFYEVVVLSSLPGGALLFDSAAALSILLIEQHVVKTSPASPSVDHLEWRQSEEDSKNSSIPPQWLD